MFPSSSSSFPVTSHWNFRFCTCYLQETEKKEKICWTWNVPCSFLFSAFSLSFSLSSESDLHKSTHLVRSSSSWRLIIFLPLPHFISFRPHIPFTHPFPLTCHISWWQLIDFLPLAQPCHGWTTSNEDVPIILTHSYFLFPSNSYLIFIPYYWNCNNFFPRVSTRNHEQTRFVVWNPFSSEFS